MSQLQSWVKGLSQQRKLSKGAQAVVGIVLSDPEAAAFASTHEIARRAAVNAATVVRAAQSLGFSGWTEFSAELRGRYLSSIAVDHMYELNAETGDILGQTLGEDLRLLHTLLQSLDPQVLQQAASLIRNSRRTGIFTTGTYAGPGQQLAHVAQMLGYDVSLQAGSATAMLGAARLLGQGDCFFTYSIWKSTTVVRQLAQLARERGATVVVVGDRRSEIAHHADLFIPVPSESRSVVPSITCTVSVGQAILRMLADADRVRTRDQLHDLNELWDQLGIVDSD